MIGYEKKCMQSTIITSLKKYIMKNARYLLLEKNNLRNLPRNRIKYNKVLFLV